MRVHSFVHDKLPKKTFNLSKWYADIISTEGECYIIYSANVFWRFFTIQYSNILHVDTKGNVRSTVKLSNKVKVSVSDDFLSVESDNLKGTWSRSLNPIRILLLESNKGNILWRCDYPLASVTLKSNQKVITGCGYAELLQMDIKPWAFDIDELYWGRFTSATTSVIWIEWRGKLNKQWLFENGIFIDKFTLTEAGVQYGDTKITFSESISLRKGSLLQTVFKNHSWLRYIFPIKILLTDEQKWLTKSILHNSKKEQIHGWCIHEKVIWQK